MREERGEDMYLRYYYNYLLVNKLLLFSPFSAFFCLFSHSRAAQNQINRRSLLEGYLSGSLLEEQE